MNPNYLQEDADVKTLVDGAKLAIALTETKPFQNLGSTMIVNPYCANTTQDIDSNLECILRQFTLTFYHPVGKSENFYLCHTTYQ